MNTIVARRVAQRARSDNNMWQVFSSSGSQKFFSKRGFSYLLSDQAFLLGLKQDSTAVSIFVDILIELTNTVYVNSTNI